MRRWLLVGAFCTLIARPAVADETCAEAFSSGPEHVKAGKLLQGKEELTRCSTEPCPASMRPLCAADLKRLEDRIPTIVFVAKDSGGHDLADVKVFEDTKTLADKIDGRSLPIDPGAHAFRFERAGSDPVTVNVVVHEGEHARAVEATIADKPVARPVEPTPPPPVQHDVETRPIPWPVYVTGGLTVASAAGWAIFGIRGIGERSDLASCKGTCAHGPVQTAKTSLLIADISLIAGIVFLGATGALYVTRPTVHETSASLPWPLQF